MIWLIAAELVLILLLITAIGVALLARIPWRWVRWSLWLMLVITCVIFALGFMYEGTQPVGMGFEDSFWKYHFTAAGHRPTQRLLVMCLGAGFIVLPLVLGAVGLWRAQRDASHSRARQWRIGRLLLGCVAATVTLIATVAVNDWLIQRELRTFLAKAEDGAEQLFSTDIRNDQNAYVVYRQAALLAAAQPAIPEFKQSKREPDHRWVTDYRLTEEELAKAEAFFKSREGVIELVDRAGQLSTYASKPTPGILWEHDLELSHWRALVEFLATEGHLSIVRGDPSRAYANAARLRRLSHHLQHDRRLLILLTATSIQRFQARLIEHAMQVRPPTAEEAEALRVEPPDFYKGLAGTLGYEEAFTKATLANLLLYESRVDLSPLARRERRAGIGAILGRLLYARDDMAAVTPHFDRWRGVAATPYQEDARLPWPRGAGVEGVALTFHLLPVTWLPNGAIRQALAYRRMSDAGIELTAGLPKLTEDAIRAKLPTVKLGEDPNDGKPLRTDVRSGGIVVYSVAHNKVDHCGVEETHTWDYGDECLFLNDEFGTYRLIECKHPDLPWPRLTRP